MTKSRLLTVLLPVTALIGELLPLGYANFAPMVTGILTVMLIILSATYAFGGNRKVLQWANTVTVAAQLLLLKENPQKTADSRSIFLLRALIM